jgi:hypothetical protein
LGDAEDESALRVGRAWPWRIDSQLLSGIAGREKKKSRDTGTNRLILSSIHCCKGFTLPILISVKAYSGKHALEAYLGKYIKIY